MSIKLINKKILDETSAKAKYSPRHRMNYNIHDDLNDPINRLLNAMEPETYIRPHRHTQPPKNESIILLRGALDILIFDDCGTLIRRESLSVTSGNYAIDIPSDSWHGLIVRQTGTVIYEIKTGPYHPVAEGDIASWSPDPENKEAVKAYIEAMKSQVLLR
jgi:cupin fold WbuC family metalloprotein